MLNIGIGNSQASVHFRLVMIVNLAVGMITPPLGVNLFAACAVAKIPIEEMLPYILPLIVVILLCLGIITYVPAVSIGILDLLG